MFNVYKMRFRVIKMLKMNIMKHSSKKHKTDKSFIFIIRHLCSIASLFEKPWKNETLQISHITLR